MLCLHLKSIDWNKIVDYFAKTVVGKVATTEGCQFGKCDSEMICLSVNSLEKRLSQIVLVFGKRRVASAVNSSRWVCVPQQNHCSDQMFGMRNRGIWQSDGWYWQSSSQSLRIKKTVFEKTRCTMWISKRLLLELFDVSIQQWFDQKNSKEVFNFCSGRCGTFRSQSKHKSVDPTGEIVWKSIIFRPIRLWSGWETLLDSHPKQRLPNLLLP